MIISGSVLCVLFLDKPTKLKLFLFTHNAMVKVVMKQADRVANAFIRLEHGFRSGYRSFFVSRTLVSGRTNDEYKISYCSLIGMNITRNYTSNHTHTHTHVPV